MKSIFKLATKSIHIPYMLEANTQIKIKWFDFSFNYNIIHVKKLQLDK